MCKTPFVIPPCGHPTRQDTERCKLYSNLDPERCQYHAIELRPPPKDREHEYELEGEKCPNCLYCCGSQTTEIEEEGSVQKNESDAAGSNRGRFSKYNRSPFGSMTSALLDSIRDRKAPSPSKTPSPNEKAAFEEDPRGRPMAEPAAVKRRTGFGLEIDLLEDANDVFEMMELAAVAAVCKLSRVAAVRDNDRSVDRIWRVLSDHVGGDGRNMTVSMNVSNALIRPRPDRSFTPLESIHEVATNKSLSQLPEATTRADEPPNDSAESDVEEFPKLMDTVRDYADIINPSQRAGSLEKGKRKASKNPDNSKKSQFAERFDSQAVVASLLGTEGTRGFDSTDFATTLSKTPNDADDLHVSRKRLQTDESAAASTNDRAGCTRNVNKTDGRIRSTEADSAENAITLKRIMAGSSTVKLSPSPLDHGVIVALPQPHSGTDTTRTQDDRPSGNVEPESNDIMILRKRSIKDLNIFRKLSKHVKSSALLGSSAPSTKPTSFPNENLSPQSKRFWATLKKLGSLRGSPIDASAQECRISGRSRGSTSSHGSRRELRSVNLRLKPRSRSVVVNYRLRSQTDKTGWREKQFPRKFLPPDWKIGEINMRDGSSRSREYVSARDMIGTAGDENWGYDRSVSPSPPGSPSASERSKWGNETESALQNVSSSKDRKSTTTDEKGLKEGFDLELPLDLLKISSARSTRAKLVDLLARATTERNQRLQGLDSPRLRAARHEEQSQVRGRTESQLQEREVLEFSQGIERVQRQAPSTQEEERRSRSPPLSPKRRGRLHMAITEATERPAQSPERTGVPLTFRDFMAQGHHLSSEDLRVPSLSRRSGHLPVPAEHAYPENWPLKSPQYALPKFDRQRKNMDASYGSGSADVLRFPDYNQALGQLSPQSSQISPRTVG